MRNLARQRSLLSNLRQRGCFSLLLLVALAFAGCHRQSENAAKPAGTNKVAGASQVTGRTNPATAVRPGSTPAVRPGTPAGPTNIVARPGVFMRSNVAGPVLRPGAKTNLVGATARPGGKTNAVAGAPGAAAKAGGVAAQFEKFRGSAAFYPVLVTVAICLGFGSIFLVQYLKTKSTKGGKAAGEAPVMVARPVVKKARRAPVNSCNVLHVGPSARHLWHFAARGRGFVLNREQTSFAGEALPSGVINKDWRSLFQRKLNIAWLPPEQVFLRVAHFPVSDFSEIVSMVELQLEKLSPIPVAQVVWSVQMLPQAEGNLQTVIVMIVARSVVEEFLGQLEGQGYLADRLELPRLDQLLATAVNGNGAWVFPDSGTPNTALVGWWYGGVLQNLALVTLSTANRVGTLKDQLLQMSWAGELEGWLTAPPVWHLVADTPTAAEWEPVLKGVVEQPIEVIASLSTPELAAKTAARAVQTEPQANLLPAEFLTRYHQQFVDRLWMRGVGAVIALYILGVLVYFARLQFELYRSGKVDQQVALVGPIYTNALQLKAKYEILRDRDDLTWAALDCWKAIAEVLPDGITLEQFNLSEGKRLTLNGTAPAGREKTLLDFDADLLKAPDKNNQPLFDSKKGDRITWHQGAAGTVTWSCSLELKRSEVL